MLRREQFSIFYNAEILYIKFENGEAIGIQGDHASLINYLITLFDKKGQYHLDEILELTESEYPANLVSSSIDWMLNNNLLANSKLKHQKRCITIFGDYFDYNDVNKFITSLNTKNITYEYKESSFTENEIEKLDIIIIFGSRFENFKEIVKLNKSLYLGDKVLIYAELDDHQITYGPICSKSLDTPCLESFFKRRISNDYENFNQTVSFLKMPSVKTYKSFNQSSLFPLFSEFLKTELADFVNFNRSSLLGNSFMYNSISKEIYKSEILKVHNLSYEDHLKIYS